MTQKSVPSLLFSRNDISRLARLFKTTFQHFVKYSSSSENNYFQSVSIIRVCYLLTLIDKKRIKFKNQPNQNIVKLSNTLNQIIFLILQTAGPISKFFSKNRAYSFIPNLYITFSSFLFTTKE